MKKSSAIQSIFTIITFLSGRSKAYRNPAHHRSPHVQYDYRDYHPSQRGSGHFESLNRSLVPWEAHHHPLDDAIALNSESNSCSTAEHKSGGFWLPNIAHQGTSPFLSDSSEYVVYRNVKDFGAKGDGSTDDSAAFNAAITGMSPLNSRSQINH
jgi:glucan 1,3-beta-glucosidase